MAKTPVNPRTNDFIIERCSVCKSERRLFGIADKSPREDIALDNIKGYWKLLPSELPRCSKHDWKRKKKQKKISRTV